MAIESSRLTAHSSKPEGVFRGRVDGRKWRSVLTGIGERHQEGLAVVRRALKPEGGEERQLIREYIRRKFGRSGTFQGNYQRWIDRFDRLSAEDTVEIRREVAAGGLPRIGVIVDLRSLAAVDIQRLATSLATQLYRPTVITAIGAERLSRSQADAVGEAFSKARIAIDLEQLPEGDAPRVDAWLLVDAAIVLAEHACVAFACAMRDRSAELVYADEDLVTPKGKRTDPFFKPAYSPLLARNTGYMGDCGLVRWSARPSSELIAELKSSGGVAELLTALAARLPAKDVVHTPFVLFSETRASRRNGVAATPDRPGARRHARVSIVIPTKDKVELLQSCIASIAATTAYPAERYEIIVIDNGSTEPATVAYIERLVTDNVASVVRDDRPFNYARLNNEAVKSASGDVLVFLNNDTEVIQADWLDRLVLQATERDVAAVGVKLLYPDMSVQHGGVILGLRGGAAHAFTDLPRHHPGYCGLSNADHEVSAVTAACLAMRRTVFDEIGGFDEDLAVAFNDTLLCIEARRHGYRNVVLESVVVLHHESKSRGADDTSEKAARARRECLALWEKGGEFLREDAFYSPNLSLIGPYSLAYPPRRKKPWHGGAKAPLKVLLLTDLSSAGGGRGLFGSRGAALLAGMGYDVHVGARRPAGKIENGGFCEHVTLRTASDAANYAVQNNIDCIVSEVEAYNRVVRWVGDYPKVILCAHSIAERASRPIALEFAVRALPLVMAHRIFRAVDAANEAMRGEGNSHREVRDEAAGHCVADLAEAIDDVCRRGRS